MKPILHMVILVDIILTSIPALSRAHGISAGHMVASETHQNNCDHDRYRYSGIYFYPRSGDYGLSYYGSDYCYTPTAEQMSTAHKQVQDYLLAVKEERKHAATHRYISVGALKPTKKQLENYAKKQLPQPADPSQLRCVMVFDTQTKQFVGSGCYVVNGKPSIGDVGTFEKISAEFVGQ